MSDAVSLISDQESSHCSSIIIELSDKKSVKNCNSFTFSRQKICLLFAFFFYSLTYLAPICVSTLDDKWSCVTMLPVTKTSWKIKIISLFRAKNLFFVDVLFFNPIFLAPIWVSTLKWLMIVDASWFILTHHDESEFEKLQQFHFFVPKICFLLTFFFLRLFTFFGANLRKYA